MSTDPFAYINEPSNRFETLIRPLLFLPPAWDAWDWQDQEVFLPGGRAVLIALNDMATLPVETILETILFGKDEMDDEERCVFSDEQCYPVSEKLVDYQRWQTFRKENNAPVWACPRMERLIASSATKD